MYCKNMSKCLNGKLKCKKTKEYINYQDCNKNCSNFIVVTNKPINKVTNKQKQLEKNRYSIFTNNYNKCFYCGKQNEKLDLHEVYGGSNRKRSMQNGLVIPLCRNCHSNEKIISYLRIQLQKEYEKNHSREQFIQLIGKNYIKEMINNENKI